MVNDNNAFLIKAKEFLDEKGMNKFHRLSLPKFSDGTLVDGWFDRNEARLSTDYETQYLIMLEQKMAVLEII